MRMFQVVYEEGDKVIIFARDKSDAWFKHPMAWLINEVIVK